MELVQNIPFFCIMISMFSGTISSVLPGKYARRLNLVMLYDGPFPRTLGQ